MQCSAYDNSKENYYYKYKDTCMSPPHINQNAYNSNESINNAYDFQMCKKYLVPYPENQLDNGIPYNPHSGCKMGIIYADRNPNSKMTWNEETIKYQKEQHANSDFDPVRNNVINGGWFYNINPQQEDNQKMCEHSFFNNDQTQPCQYSTVAIPTESTLLFGCRKC